MQNVDTGAQGVDHDHTFTLTQLERGDAQSISGSALFVTSATMTHGLWYTREVKQKNLILGLPLLLTRKMHKSTTQRKFNRRI